MSIRVHVGGQIVPPENALVSVFDRGFLYGDSVFDTVATAGGQLFALAEHIERLQRSAAAIGIVPPSREEIEIAVHATVTAAGNRESRVRMVITRGDGGSDLDPLSSTEPRLVIIAGPRGGPTPQMYVDGVGIAVVSVARNHPQALDPAVKSGNYLNNVLALGQARRSRPGVHEAILCSTTGSLAEGASSNLFLVHEGCILTPALSVGILPGITRAVVIELCGQAGLPCQELDFLAPELLVKANEIFITSAVRGILPVTRLEGAPVGDGRPGPVTRRLRRLYLQRTGEPVTSSAQRDEQRDEEQQ